MKTPEEQQEAIRSMEATALQSTENMKRMLISAEDTGQQASEMLQDQARRIVAIDKTLFKVETGLQDTDQIVKKMRLFPSPFGFTGKAAKYAFIFQSKHGGPADWSGPLRVQHRFMPYYQKRFAALAGRVLYLYKDASHLVNETNIVDIKDAKVREIQAKLKIVVTTPEGAKVVLKCANEDDYRGWSYMLKAEAENRRISKSSTESVVFQESKRQELGASQRPEENAYVQDNDLQKLISPNLDFIDSKLDGLKTRSLELMNQVNHQDRLVTGLTTTVDRVSSKFDESMTVMRKHA